MFSGILRKRVSYLISDRGLPRSEDPTNMLLLLRHLQGHYQLLVVPPPVYLERELRSAIRIMTETKVRVCGMYGTKRKAAWEPRHRA
jgi:hypothetical protein